ncbi:MAG: polyprenyl synthetase family protein [Planctomycetota bacterium]|nr:MAG: polyprenyl synthetase family protein [Planctomycetota bacterium]
MTAASPSASQRPFPRWLHSVIPEIEEALRQRLAAENLKDAPEVWRRAVQAAVMSPGKRVRPAMVLLACQAHGGSHRRAMPAAVAVELIHAYSLVHDDLPCMDDDALRRGQPTVHVQFGEANAVLAGDGLQALAFEVLAEQEDAALARDQTALLARASGAVGMVGGQVWDLEAEGRPCTLAQVSAIHAAKTGALLKASLQMGARAAGADPGLWEPYGQAVGCLFQAADDLLDATGSTEELGKTAGKDAVSEKATLLRAAGWEKARQHATALVRSAERALAELPLTRLREPLEDLPHFLLERNR